MDSALPSPDRPELCRRAFLQEAALAGAIVGSAAFAVEAVAGNPLPLPVPGKHPGLRVHAAMPSEIETPLALLRQHELTPKELLFVRNNQQLAGSQTLAPFPAADAWEVEFTGLVKEKRRFPLRRIRELPTEEVEVVLQCSGNGRHWFAQAAPPKPGDKLWQCGALGNVRFQGVRLAAVLAAAAVEPLPEARFLTAEGADTPIHPGEDDFEHSLPLDDALKRSLLVWRLNGEELPAIHGGPLRLLTPGYYGTMHLKWLTRLRLEAEESRNYHHERRYRTPKEQLKPGTRFRYSIENSESNWRMKIKSIIWQPLEGEVVPAGRDFAIAGVAWNDGSCPVESVEISVDEGQTWRRARLNRPASPYAWYPWFLSLSLPRGNSRLLARAIDAWGRTQPLDGVVHWNPSGYAWNGVHAVNVRVE